MAARRQDKINEEIARELTSILRTVKDPRVSGAFISVTARTSAATCRWRACITACWAARTARTRGLASAAGYIRSELAARLNLRVTPKLVFLRDDSAERAMKISEILKDIDEDGNAER